MTATFSPSVSPTIEQNAVQARGTAQELFHRAADSLDWLGPIRKMLDTAKLRCDSFDLKEDSLSIGLRHPSLQTPVVLTIDIPPFYCIGPTRGSLPFATKEEKLFAVTVTKIDEYIRNLRQIRSIAKETSTSLETAHSFFLKPWAWFLARSVLKARGSTELSPFVRSITFGPEFVHLGFASPETYGRGPWDPATAPYVSLYTTVKGDTKICLCYPKAAQLRAAPETKAHIEELYAPLYQQAVSAASTMGRVFPLFSQAKDSQQARRTAFAHFWLMRPLIVLSELELKVTDISANAREARLQIAQEEVTGREFTGSLWLTRQKAVSGKHLTGDTSGFAEALSALRQGKKVVPSWKKTTASRAAFGAFSSLGFVSGRGCDRHER